MLTLGYSEDGDQPLTETVKNEIETFIATDDSLVEIWHFL